MVKFGTFLLIFSSNIFSVSPFSSSPWGRQLLHVGPLEVAQLVDAVLMLYECFPLCVSFG